MGLTSQDCGFGTLREAFNIESSPGDKIIALAGNPNTGKSTLFNALTGLNQHTGNWPGKTVLQAKGTFRHQGDRFILVDLPGTYSLLAKSAEEETARDFICFAKPDATIVVADATSLERNLNLALQIIEITPRVVLCVNLMDEARRKGLSVDTEILSAELGVPVVAAAARSGKGLPELLEVTHRVADGTLSPVPKQIVYEQEIEKAVRYLEPMLRQTLKGSLNPRWAALRLLEGDPSILEAIERYCCPYITQELEVRLRHELKFGSV